MSALYPLRLAPSWRKKIWGSTDLSPLYPAGGPTLLSPLHASAGPTAPPSCAPAFRRIGEVWFTFEENIVTNGPLAGHTLASLMERHGADLMGTAFRSSRLRRRSAGDAARSAAAPPQPYFPILVKFLFTSEKLSVQVHPDDAYALAHEDGPGKTEMWYVLRADPGAAIALGLTEPLDPDALRRAAVSGEIVRYLNWVPVKAGDAILSPSGTLHSIGAGLALCEIQQNSDLTYRFHDFGRLGDDGRPRALHIDQAVAVTRLDRHPGPLEPAGETLVECSHFAVERTRWTAGGRYTPDPARMHLLIFLEGSGRLGEEPFQPGDVYLIPAAAPAFDWAAAQPALLLRAYVP